MTALFVFLMIVAFLTIDWFVRRARAPRLELSYAVGRRPAPALRPSEIPAGYFFSPEHAWAHLLEDGTVRVGADAFVTNLLGAASVVDLLSDGEQVVRGDHMAVYRQDGRKVRFSSPLSGTVLEKNPALTENPSLISAHPFENGWLYRLRPEKLDDELPRLMLAGRAKEWLATEAKRVRDFLAHATATTGLALQDGGEPVTNALTMLDANVWQQFESNFLAASQQERA